MELDDRMASGEGHGSDESKAARQQYFRELFRLQGELVKLQDWVVATCLLYTSPSPRDRTRSRMPSSA